MSNKVPRNRTSSRTTTVGDLPSLAEVLEGVAKREELSPIRQRDLCSAVRKVAKLLGDNPSSIRLDIPVISAGLARVNPVAAGLSDKRLSNIRSDFLAAVSASGLGKLVRLSRFAPSAQWTALLDAASRRTRIGLSRLGRFASQRQIEPCQIDNRVLEEFVEWVRQNSLNPRPAKYLQQIATIWNELARSSSETLRSVDVPTSKRDPQRIDLKLLPASFSTDQENYLTWCGGADPFDKNARLRSLAGKTIELRRNQIHSAVTALVESGVAPGSITGLASLVEPEAFKRIMRRRLEIAGNDPNAFNHGLAGTLVQVAREWVKPESATIAELKRLFGRIPAPRQGLTTKNKVFLRQFDDPDTAPRLYRLAQKLFHEARRDSRQGFAALAKAQAALAIEILCYMPIRAKNLATLEFDQHIFLADHVRGISSLELSPAEVKNDEPIAFDVPSSLAEMLRAYREQVAPKIVGHRPRRLFVNVDGSPKSQDAISDLIIRYARRRAGIVITPHQFRHLNAKLILDDMPGAFETVRQLLGHKALKTTTGAYTGINTRRAARHHHRLIQEMLAEQTQRSESRRNRRSSERGA
jgi:integrase